MSATEQTLALLTRIAVAVEKLAAQGSGGQAGAVASDRDLDGQYGDEKVSFNPKDWTGPSMKGKRMSQCPAEFLDLLAETYDYFAGKADEKGETHNGKPVAPYKRKSAARARGWAKRVREGKGKAAPASASSDDEWGQDSGYGSGGDW